MKKPIIFVNTDGFAKFCDNRCNNTKCKKHLSQMCGYYGGAKISKLRNTPDCEGYISKQKQSIEEIAKQFEAMEREAKKEINKDADKSALMYGVSRTAAGMVGENPKYTRFITDKAKKVIENIAKYKG